MVWFCIITFFFNCKSFKFISESCILIFSRISCVCFLFFFRCTSSIEQCFSSYHILFVRSEIVSKKTEKNILFVWSFCVFSWNSQNMGTFGETKTENWKMWSNIQLCLNKIIPSIWLNIYTHVHTYYIYTYIHTHIHVHTLFLWMFCLYIIRAILKSDILWEMWNNGLCRFLRSYKLTLKNILYNIVIFTPKQRNFKWI